MPYDFPDIFASDRSLFGVHTWWGKGSRGWSPIMGMKQVEAPYLYGYAVRIKGRFFGLCRERHEDKPLIRYLDSKDPAWDSFSDESSPSPDLVEASSTTD